MSISNNKMILIIDDSNTNIVLLDAILAEKGYETKTAYNANEAQQIISKTIPDLILLDLLMPKISGYDFLKNLKKTNEYRDIPVIIVSAHIAEESKNETKKLGAVDFIDKPIDIEILEEKVFNIFNK